MYITDGDYSYKKQRKKTSSAQLYIIYKYENDNRIRNLIIIDGEK